MGENTGSWAGFKHTKTGKVVYPRKKHTFTWKRLAYIAMAINDTDGNRDYAPLRALIKVAVRRLYENVDYDTVKKFILSLINEDEELKQTIKAIYMAAVKFVLAKINPDDPVFEFIGELEIMFANWLINSLLEIQV